MTGEFTPRRMTIFSLRIDNDESDVKPEQTNKLIKDCDIPLILLGTFILDTFQTV